MCLFPGMMQPVVPPSEKALKYKKILCLTAIIHLLFSFLIMFFDVYEGFVEMINALILSCAA